MISFGFVGFRPKLHGLMARYRHHQASLIPTHSLPFAIPIPIPTLFAIGLQGVVPVPWHSNGFWGGGDFRVNFVEVGSRSPARLCHVQAKHCIYSGFST